MKINEPATVRFQEVKQGDVFVHGTIPLMKIEPIAAHGMHYEAINVGTGDLVSIGFEVQVTLKPSASLTLE